MADSSPEPEKPDNTSLNRQKFIDKNDYVIFGTPIELNEDELEIGKKPIKIEDQVVKDERGRRIFHGAFTGGFSAGYFNTCGSEKGWTPSAFVSSRSDRKQSQEQNPEYFMDEEDFSEFGIAPKKYSAQSKFAEKRSSVKDVIDKSMSSHQTLRSIVSDSDLFESLNIVRKSTVGYDLMRKMGWREGRGLGEQILVTKSVDKSKKTYGCSLPPHLLKNQDHFVGPQEEAVKIPSPKKDMYGLGYVSLRIQACSLTENKNNKNVFKPTGSEQKGITGSAYCVDQNDSYADNNIYHDDSIEQYDFSIDPTPADSDQPQSTSNQKLWYNFIKPKQKTEFLSKQYNLPVIPDNFKPNPILGPGVSKFSLICQTDSRSRAKKLNEQVSSQKIESTNNDLSEQLKKRFVSSGEQLKTVSDFLLQEKIDAARSGIYGKLTRNVQVWQPLDILCRRFNIVCIGSTGMLKKNETEKERNARAGSIIIPKSTQPSEKKPGPLSVLNPGYTQAPSKIDDILISSSDVKTVKQDKIPLESKPSIDLFKAVFCDESDDETHSDSAPLSFGSKKRSLNEDKMGVIRLRNI